MVKKIIFGIASVALVLSVVVSAAQAMAANDMVVAQAPLAFRSPITGQTFNVGERYAVTWTGGEPKYYVYLIGGQYGTAGRRLGTAQRRTSEDLGRFTWTVPNGIANGDYRFKFTPIDPGTPSYETVQFKIYKKIPIKATLEVTSSCLVPGRSTTVTAKIVGDDITSKILEKDTNNDREFGQVASWGAGAGTHTYTTNEPASYTGNIVLKLKVNGKVSASKTIRVNPSCGQNPGNPGGRTSTTTASSTPIVGTIYTTGLCFAPGVRFPVTVIVRGSGVTSQTLEKDTNTDGVFGEIASWGAGTGTHVYTTNEPETYTGRIDFKLKINGVLKDLRSVTVSRNCPGIATSSRQY